MLLTKKKIDFSKFTIKLNDTELENCDSYKYLGVFFDKDLNWKTHIDYISNKISKSCGILAKLRHCLEIDTLREVYHALIHSYLRYGIIAWGSATKTTLNKLQILANRALRIMSFAPFGHIDLNPLYEILEILKIEDIYKLEIAKLAFKQHKNLLPVKIASYFEAPLVNNLRRSSRLNSRTQAVISNTTYGSRSLQQKIRQVWNEIPEEIKNNSYFNSYKRMLKSHLILLYF